MVLNETYELKYEIGHGGTSKVYLAEHKRLHTEIAVKVINKQPNISYDLLAESNILKRLQHPMLPRIMDVLEDADHIYIVEDYVRGVTLEELLKNQRSIPEKQCIQWFKELCGVLEFLHSQRPNPIIYRDIKPSNIMLQSDGGLKLIDFGIAREYKASANSDTAYIGTRGYAAPEQFGTSQTDARTDIYSLGITMYHLLTGKGPFDAPYCSVPVRQLDSALSRGIELIIKKCIQINPEERYQNIAELLYDLDHISQFDKAWKKFNRARKLRVISVVLLLVLSFGLLFTGGFLIISERTQEQWKNEYETGISYMDLERYEEAAEQFTKALQYNKDNASVYAARGEAFYQLGQFKEAELDYQRALEKELDPEYFQRLSNVQLTMGNLEKAGETIADGYKATGDPELAKTEEALTHIATLTGKICMWDGSQSQTVLSGARVTIHSLERDMLDVDMVTQEDGTFSGYVMPGKYTISLSATGYFPVSFEMMVMPDEERSELYWLLKNEKGIGSVQGIVEDANANIPVQGVEVQLFSGWGGDETKVVFATALTDENGCFTFGSQPVGYYTVVAKKDEYESTEVRYVSSSKSDSEMEISMIPSHGHRWQDADYQNPETCTICGLVKGETLEATFEKYNLTTSISLGEPYEFETSCTDPEQKTIGSILVKDYSVIDSDGEHSPKEGYEWKNAEVEISFSDRNFQSYGYNFVFVLLDYYEGYFYERIQESDETVSKFTYYIRFNGELVECSGILVHTKSSYEENGTYQKENFTVSFLVPKGYDGMVVGAIDGDFYVSTDGDLSLLDTNKGAFFRMS